MAEWPFHDGCGGVIRTLDHGNDIIGRFPLARVCMWCGESWSDLATYRALREEFGGSILTPFGSEAWTRRREVPA